MTAALSTPQVAWPQYEPVGETGLAVTPRLSKHAGQWRFTGSWWVVHLGSGLGVIHAPGAGLGHARDAAELLAESGIDWTRPAAELRTHPQVKAVHLSVSDRVSEAVRENRPVLLRDSSFRRVPPLYEVEVLDRDNTVVDDLSAGCLTYGEAEDVALDIGFELGLHSPGPYRRAAVDVRITRRTEPEWTMRCAHHGCDTAVLTEHGDIAIVATPGLLTEFAAGDQWRRLDQHRWLCDECAVLFATTHVWMG